MKFIPDSIRRLFSRSSRKAEAAETAPESAAPAAPETQPPVNLFEAQQTVRREQLEQFRKPEGYYVLDLEINVPGQMPDGQFMHMVRSNDSDFLFATVGPTPLTGTNKLTSMLQEYIQQTYGIETGHMWFVRPGDKYFNQRGVFMGQAPDFYVDGSDELCGLPPGTEFKIALVPQGCAWGPTENVLPTHRAIPGTGTVLQHPAVLAQPYQPGWELTNINGFDVKQPRLPDLPSAPDPLQKKDEPAVVAQPAAADPASVPKADTRPIEVTVPSVAPKPPKPPSAPPTVH